MKRASLAIRNKVLVVSVLLGAAFSAVVQQPMRKH
jgi:hypothetical protein